MTPDSSLVVAILYKMGFIRFASLSGNIFLENVTGISAFSSPDIML